MAHPMQELRRDTHGVVRFTENKLVRFLLEEGDFDLNDLARLFYDDETYREDWEQFAQLIGYSVAGFGDLSYTSDAVYEEAAAQAEEMA